MHKGDRVLRRWVFCLVVFSQGVLHCLLERLDRVALQLHDVGHANAVLVKQVLRQLTVADTSWVLQKLLPGIRRRTLLILNSVSVLSANENRQVVHVAKLFGCHDAVGCTALAGTGRSSGPVDEQLHLGGEVVVDNVLEERNIDTSGGQIGDQKHTAMLLAEPEQALVSRALVHCTVNVLRAEA